MIAAHVGALPLEELLALAPTVGAVWLAVRAGRPQTTRATVRAVAAARAAIVRTVFQAVQLRTPCHRCRSPITSRFCKEAPASRGFFGDARAARQNLFTPGCEVFGGN